MVLKELTQLCFNLWLQIRVGISSTHDYINKSLHKKNQRSPHLARLKPWHRLLYHQTLHHQSRNRRRPLLTQELRRSMNRLLPRLSLTRAASSLPYRGRWRMERHRHDEPGITRAPIISKLNKLFMKKICFCFCSLIHAWVRVSSLSLSYKKDVMSMSNGPIRGPVSYKWGSYRKIWVRIP